MTLLKQTGAVAGAGIMGISMVVNLLQGDFIVTGLYALVTGLFVALADDGT